MIKRNMKKLLVIIGLAALINTANAIPLPYVLNLGTTTGQPADLNSEFSRLVGQIDIYNLGYDPDIPTPINNGVKTETPNGGTYYFFNSPEPFNGYLLFKWGNEDQFYYVENLTFYIFGSTVQNQHSNKETFLGLSHTTFWELPNKSVPESGNGLVLLSMSIVGMFLTKKIIIS